MKNSSKPIFHDHLLRNAILGISLLIAEFLIAIFYYGMRYPKLSFAKPLLLNLAFIGLNLPLLLGVFGMALRALKNPHVNRFFEHSAVLAAVLGVLCAIVLALYPPFCSSTTSLNAYLHLDRTSDSSVHVAQETILPDTVPQASTDPRYQYYHYRSIKEDTTYLTLGITLPKADFTTEQTRLTAIQDLTPKQTDPTILLLTGSSDGTSITITLDSQYHRIIYTIHQQKIK